MTVVVGRRERVFEAMDAAGLDALVLGRPANVAYVSGADALWTSGSRPFSPSCVVVGRAIHLLATWDEGVPADIPTDNLFGLSWNPRIAADRIRAIEGLSEARRIGTDGTSVSFQRLVGALAPAAEVVDARAVLAGTRVAKTDEEVLAIEGACAAAEHGLTAMVDAAAPGATERSLLGVLAEQLGGDGSTVIPDEAVARITAAGFRHVATDRRLADGDLLALTPSARVGGYDGTIGRTIVVGGSPSDEQSALGHRCRAALDAVIARCTPGATGRTLLGAWTDAGGGDLPVPLVHGLGLGTEAPLIGLGVGVDETLALDAVLAVQGWCYDRALGGWLERDVIHLTRDGPRTLTRWSRE